MPCIHACTIYTYMYMYIDYIYVCSTIFVDGHDVHLNCRDESEKARVLLILLCNAVKSVVSVEHDRFFWCWAYRTVC